MLKHLIYKLTALHTLKTYFSESFYSSDIKQHPKTYAQIATIMVTNKYCKAFAKTTCTSVSRDEKGACHPFLQIKKVKRVVL